MTDIVRIEKAFAKINLGLKIIGKRPDGYHEICSLVQTVNLADLLYFSPAESTSVCCSDQAVPTNGQNLIDRSVDLFYETLDLPRKHYCIGLEKSIPVGAGLGGGSSDAAATLRCLNHLHGHPLDIRGLRGLGAQLGSDIPFLVQGGTAVIRGRGEKINAVFWPHEVYYTLVYPNVAVSTSWAYSQIGSDLTENERYINILSSLSGGCFDLWDLLNGLENDFLPIVENAYPIVATIRSRLESAGALISSLSGSGSTIYGLFDDRNAALKACDELRERGYRSFFCQPVSHSNNNLADT
ncbi:MAG: 4-(cytidine 5'-diphospho)-2-C-methyl-D-erythritol kinase [Candidatus Latescibacterota bacterium]|nr:4-(cytidine 5'-diphospho)-2-C-methyl-D-erythritol kinase [Candidatus Latescibacterota bacterium]